MKSWRIKSDEIARAGRRELFSTRELRVGVIDLAGSGEVAETGGSGGVDLTSGDETISCADGTLVALVPGEAGAVRAIEQSRLLLTSSISAGFARAQSRLRLKRSQSQP